MVTSNVKRPGKLFVIAGPSGSGKSTLVSKILPRLEQLPIERVITYTTKLPRPHDIPGKDYHFLSEEEFKKKIEEGFFLEYSTFYQAYYGSPLSILEKLQEGISLLIVLDYSGVCSVVEHYKYTVPIHVQAENESVLLKRLAERATEDKDQILLRLDKARREAEKESLFQLFKHKIINIEIDEALNSLEEIIRNELRR